MVKGGEFIWGSASCIWPLSKVVSWHLVRDARHETLRYAESLIPCFVVFLYSLGLVSFVLFVGPLITSFSPLRSDDACILGGFSTRDR